MVLFKKPRTILLIALCLLTSAAFGFGGAVLANHFFPSQTSEVPPFSKNTDDIKQELATGKPLSIQDITKKAQASVVEIKTESVSTDPWMQQYVTEGAGSGVIIKSNGYILTNRHVVDGASKIEVSTLSENVYDAKIVGSDADNDVAVLKIHEKDLTSAAIGNSRQLKVGDLAVAIGNPLGELGGTVTTGIISALDRSISIEGKTMSLLQTDASINPGNSGGGLFNQYGQLVGLVVAKSAGSDIEGLGFAIPVNRAINVADQLIKNGYVKGQVTTGMAYIESAQQDGSKSFFDQFWGESSSTAVYIQEIVGKNAKKAGFKKGDLVYSVDGTKIDSFESLSSIITSHKVGDRVKYIIIRNDQKITIHLKLAEKTTS